LVSQSGESLMCRMHTRMVVWIIIRLDL
jgi:hypothetical protein